MKNLLRKIGLLKTPKSTMATGPDVPLAIAPQDALFAGCPLRITAKVDLEKLLTKLYQAEHDTIDPTINEDIFDLLWHKNAVKSEAEKKDYARSVDAAIEVRNAICKNYVEVEISKAALDGTWGVILYNMEEKTPAEVFDYATEPLARLGAAVKAYKQMQEAAGAEDEAYINAHGGVYCMPDDK